MPNILIYYPANKSSNVIETIAKGFIDSGHKVFLLTQTGKGDLHRILEKQGVIVDSFVFEKRFSFTFYLRHILFLISFCKRNNIDAMQSHLQQANIIAVFAQFFIKARVVICRHHLIEPNKMSAHFDKFINKLAKMIIVPSEVIRTKMITEEKVNPAKVKLVPYVYNFDNYPTPDMEKVNEIKGSNPNKLLILLCGRFVPLKRNELVFQAVKQLIEEKYDVKLLALDEGPGLESAKSYVKDNNLENDVEFLGYRKNVMDFIFASDVLVHPSYTEASNNSVKEAGIHSKNVIVCSGVGDFSEYIIHKKNGYLADREDPLKDIVWFLKEIYEDENRKVIGDELKKTVYEKFHRSELIIRKHLELLLN